MYLRLGWVIGTVGLKNALLIIVISNIITLFTCFSVASIATNMRIGAGGAYAIISKSLGSKIISSESIVIEIGLFASIF